MRNFFETGGHFEKNQLFDFLSRLNVSLLLEICDFIFLFSGCISIIYTRLHKEMISLSPLSIKTLPAGYSSSCPLLKTSVSLSDNSCVSWLAENRGNMPMFHFEGLFFIRHLAKIRCSGKIGA